MFMAVLMSLSAFIFVNWCKYMFMSVYMCWVTKILLHVRVSMKRIQSAFCVFSIGNISINCVNSA